MIDLIALNGSVELFGCGPRVQNIAKNIIECDLHSGFSNLRRHEALAVVVKLHFLWIRPIHITPPRLRPTSTCQKLNSTAPPKWFTFMIITIQIFNSHPIELPVI